MAVGRRLRKARLDAGLTQRALSFPGCSVAYVSRIEAGQRVPSLQVLRELAGRLGVSEEYLAYGRDLSRLPDPLVEAEVALRMEDHDVAARLFHAEYESKDPLRRAAASEGLGQLAFQEGKLEESISLLEDASRLYRDAGVSQPGLYDTLGRAYAAVGDVEAAVALFERELRTAEEREDLSNKVRFATLLSYALADAGRLDQASEVLAEALARADELVDPQTRVRLYWAQCRLHILHERPDVAERYARRVIELLEVTEDSYHLARAHRLMANIELDRGRPTEAFDLLERAEVLLGEADNEGERALIHLLRAIALVQRGEPNEAAALAMELAGRFRDLPNESGRSYALLARSFAEAGEHSRAIELYELACELLEQTPDRYLVRAYAELADLLEAEGRKDEALQVLRKAVGLKAPAATGFTE